MPKLVGYKSEEKQDICRASKYVLKIFTDYKRKNRKSTVEKSDRDHLN